MGPSGTGKTTLGLILGAKFNLKIVHLDSIYWKKNWHHINKEDFDMFMKDFFITHDKWVIDGNYSNNLHFKYRLDLADTIIFLDFGTQQSLKGIHERAKKYKHRSRSDMAEGCNEGIDQAFLQYTAFFDKKAKVLKAIINTYKDKKKVLIFKTRKEVNNWVRSL